MREIYTLKNVIQSCAFYGIDLDLQICKDCSRFWICNTRPKKHSNPFF